MPFTPLIMATLEHVLNRFLWRDPGLKPARQRLQGKVLRIEIKEFSHPLILVFNQQQLDVLGQWEAEADCRVITHLATLSRLRDRQQLTPAIRSGELEVHGDIQVVQNWLALIDLAEFDPAELLAPYIGDIAAEGIDKLLRKAGRQLKERLSRDQQYLAEAITEEWQMAPGSLQVAWFAEETAAASRAADALSARIERLERK